jgi:hypothetical protein
VPQAPNDQHTTALGRALRTLLRPLVRLLLEHQVTYPALTRLLKEVYVEVADADFRLPTKRQTDSRVSLLTGVHRKEVSRLRLEPPDSDAAPASISLGSAILSRWVGMPEYHGEDGRPRPLPRQAAAPGDVSFETLVETVSKDIRPRAVLDEWVRLRLASVDADGQVVLNAEAFVPDQGFEEKVWFFGRNLRDHIAVGAHNLAGEAPPQLDRSVYYGQLTRASQQELEALARELGMDALRQVNQRALELQRHDGKRSDAPSHRMNFGVYFYADPPDEAPPPSEDAPGG